MTVHHEYAVKVGDRGWAVGGFGDIIRPEPPDAKSGGIYLLSAQVQEAANSLRLKYIALGAVDIAEQVTVLTRIVTTTYSGWAHPAETATPAVNS